VAAVVSAAGDSRQAEEVWSAQDTNPDAIEAALREMLRELHAADQTLAPARVLNLVVIVDREWKGEIANRLEHVGRYHASRTILCAVEQGRETIDAVAVMSYAGTAGPVGVLQESVEIDIGPSHLPRIDTIVDPVLVSELPTMVWSPHGHREAVDALLPLIDVILLDSDGEDDAAGAFVRAHELRDTVYVVDLAWLRTTPWRERLAAAFDPPERLPHLEELDGISVRHRADSAASATLLVGWLASRLGWEPAPLSPMGGDVYGRFHGVARGGAGEVQIKLDPTDQTSPGLAGVTVAWCPNCSLSLDRGEGGLDAREADGHEDERTWKVLGASRGEAGILGEGVRQALLRDPTYPPALSTAQVFMGSDGSAE
jgi:glucose-6-phosphate dehydrogenase assembly protein OpcA